VTQYTALYKRNKMHLFQKHKESIQQVIVIELYMQPTADNCKLYALGVFWRVSARHS